MSITAIIPGLGLDRSQRAPVPETASRSEASETYARPIAESSGRVGNTAAADLPGQAGSGLGEQARENLFRAITGRGEEAAGDGPDDLSEAEEEQVRDLKARDTEVRRHEEAHARVGGQYAGQPTYSYQTGPDGKRYAIGGEVSIDVSPIPDDPQGTIAKMDVVIAAALAPAEPSGQDRKVAALASRQRLEATAELTEERHERFNEQGPSIKDALQTLDAAGRTTEFEAAA